MMENIEDKKQKFSFQNLVNTMKTKCKKVKGLKKVGTADATFVTSKMGSCSKAKNENEVFNELLKTCEVKYPQDDVLKTIGELIEMKEMAKPCVVELAGDIRSKLDDQMQSESDPLATALAAELPEDEWSNSDEEDVPITKLAETGNVERAADDLMKSDGRKIAAEKKTVKIYNRRRLRRLGDSVSCSNEPKKRFEQKDHKTKDGFFYIANELLEIAKSLLNPRNRVETAFCIIENEINVMNDQCSRFKVSLGSLNLAESFAIECLTITIGSHHKPTTLFQEEKDPMTVVGPILMLRKLLNDSLKELECQQETNKNYRRGLQGCVDEEKNGISHDLPDEVYENLEKCCAKSEALRQNISNDIATKVKVIFTNIDSVEKELKLRIIHEETKIKGLTDKRDDVSTQYLSQLGDIQRQVDQGGSHFVSRSSNVQGVDGYSSNDALLAEYRQMMQSVNEMSSIQTQTAKVCALIENTQHKLKLQFRDIEIVRDAAASLNSLIRSLKFLRKYFP